MSPSSCPRTEGYASLLLDEYEELNSDLPKLTRQQLGMFVIAPLVGRRALEALFGRPLGQTPFRHRSWMWYTALRSSGLGHLWENFASLHNEGAGLRAALDWVKVSAPTERWATMERRLMKTERGLQPSDWRYGDNTPSRDVWTAGGTWHRENNMTKIIVLGEHIERDDYNYSQLTRALGPEGARALEREVHGLIDPDELLVPDAKFQAIDYVRRSVPRIADWGIPRCSPVTASWFFQEPIQLKGTPYFHDWRRPDIQRSLPHGKPTNERWEWFPSEEVDDETS